MARIRSIKPEIRTSEKVNRWPIEVRYFWVMLWGYVDDYGKGRDNARLIVADAFPLDDEVSAERVEGWLGLLESDGVIVRYEVAGTRYLAVVNWREHQKPSHPARSVIPDPPESSGNPREGLARVAEGRSGTISARNSSEPVAVAESYPQAGDAVVSEGSNPAGSSGGAGPASASWRGSNGDSGETRESSGNPREGLAKVAVNGSPEQGAGSREQGAVEQGGTRAKRAARGARIPDPFIVTGEMRSWAAAETPNVDIDAATARFVDYWRGVSGAKGRKVDWVATWRNWLRRDQDDAAGRAGVLSRDDRNLSVVAALAAQEQKAVGW